MTCKVNESIHHVCCEFERLSQQAQCSDAVARCLMAEHEHVTRTLRAFYLASMTTSSLQPVLDLAIELNPDLARLES